MEGARGEWAVTAHRHVVSLGDDKALELDSGNNHNLVNLLKSTESYTLKIVNFMVHKLYSDKFWKKRKTKMIRRNFSSQ